MQKVPSNDRRKLLPRWRPLSRVPPIELASTRRIGIVGPDFSAEFADAEREWASEATSEAAAELVEAAATFGERDGAQAAAKTLLSKGDLRPLGVKIARGVLGQSPSQSMSPVEQIREGKRLLSAYPNNAVLRSQMALAYVSTGQRSSAHKQMQLALMAAPRSRFVLRSAARFFVHDGDPERALHIVERTGNTDDPWVLATLTSLSDLVQKTKSVSSRQIRSVLSSDLHPAQLVELAISFATLEISHGSMKPARKLINQFSGHLNENAAAQIKWIEEDVRTGFNIDLAQISNSFEANALAFHNGGEFKRAVKMTERWFDDEPFSPRAAILGSYISSAYNDENDRAIALIDKALVANPSDVSLLNNKAFALSQANRIEEARRWLERAKAHQGDLDSKVTLAATEANILVRSGQVQEGLDWYARAALDAVKEKLFETRDRMIAHWFRELYFHGFALEEKILKRFLHHYRDGGSASLEARRLFNHIARPLIEKQAAENRPVFIIGEEGILLETDLMSQADH